MPLLLGICPLWSYRLAVRFHNDLPGIVVPETLQEALREAGPSAADVGMEHARALLEAARDRVAGVYLVVPYRQPLRVLELLA
jgi:homocysteine S-methyltransferase